MSRSVKALIESAFFAQPTAIARALTRENAGVREFTEECSPRLAYKQTSAAAAGALEPADGELVEATPDDYAEWAETAAAAFRKPGTSPAGLSEPHGEERGERNDAEEAVDENEQDRVEAADVGLRRGRSAERLAPDRGAEAERAEQDEQRPRDESEGASTGPGGSPAAVSRG